jgi:hypothetical protein
VARAHLLIVAPVLFMAGCVSLPQDPNGAAETCPSLTSAATANDTGPRKKGPRTLFEWAVHKEKKEEKNGKAGDKGNGDDKRGNDGEGSGKKDATADKNENGGPDKEKNEGKGKKDGEEEGGEEAKPLETDRPDFTEASSTVGKGRVQLEAGYTFIRDRQDGGTTRTHSFPEALLRIGLFADWFELRLGQNFTSTSAGAGQGAASTVITGPSAGVAAETQANASGPEDLYLGIKLGLTEQKKSLPESALVLQTTVPTGSRSLTAGQLLPGINYLFGWDVIEDLLSVGGSFQANRSRDPSNHFYVEVAQSLTAGYRLTRRLGAYAEWFAFYPAGAIDPGVGPEHYLDGGFTFLVNDDFQLDARAGVGLNDHADDFFTGVGFAVRY